MFFNFLGCPKCLSYLAETWSDFVFTGLLWVVFWKGNEWLSDFPDRYVGWKESPMLRLLFGLLVHSVFTFLASIVLTQLFSFFQNGTFRSFSIDQLLGFNLPAVIIALVISLFLTARSFLFSWRDLAIEHEKLKVESMTSRFASLKAQVNPHFLFNSLNVLSGLVYRDADLSAQFIQKLAEVYRYVLDQQEEELVGIQTELEFVESVIFLQRIRFGEDLRIKIDIPKDASFMVAPLALQMLIENAIKHNIVSAEQPLSINIKLEQDYLVVDNSLQLKTVMADSLGVGLQNIENRYGFLTNKPVVVQKEAEQFIVKLPIIDLS